MTEEQTFVPITLQVPRRWVEIDIRDMGDQPCVLCVQVRRWHPGFWWAVIRAIWAGRQ